MNYDSVKNRKRFYVHSYRRAIRILLISLLLNGLFVAGIYYKYITRPERDFYASDGITAPIQLNSLMQANNSTSALLPPDPVLNNETKVIPN